MSSQQKNAEIEQFFRHEDISSEYFSNYLIDLNEFYLFLALDSESNQKTD